MEPVNLEQNHSTEIHDKEIEAIGKLYEILKNLPNQSVERVLSYMCRVFLKDTVKALGGMDKHNCNFENQNLSKAPIQDENESHNEMNPIAVKWLKRNSVSIEELSLTFSVGLDEYDIVAKKIPGKSKKEKTKIIFLLMGAASYLKNGTLKFSHENAKETCQHYDAWDTDNFSTYLKTYVGEVSGNKSSGYILTARGLASATELIKQIANL